MRFFLVALWILLISPLGRAYDPAHQDLLEGKTQKFLEHLSQVLQEPGAEVRSQSLLTTILQNQRLFYKPESFSSTLFNLKKENCPKKEKAFCGRFRNYDFEINKSLTPQKMSIHKKKQIIFEWPARLQSKLKKGFADFGTSVHLIWREDQSNTLFFLIGIREFEKSKENLLFRRLNLFRLRKGNICRIAQTDLVEDPDRYSLMIELLRTVGDSLHCPPDVIKI